MSLKDELGTRMKENYETISKYRLTRRMPVAIRIDGKAFHTLTRGFAKPFDEVLMYSMQQTMKMLCENIQGCVLGYTQSDEITLILIDYTTFNTDAWFDNEVQKICSVSASMATRYFNEVFSIASQIEIDKLEKKLLNEYFHADSYQDLDDVEMKHFGDVCMETGVSTIIMAYDKAKHSAMFDSRCFSIPKEEVTNLIYWRQLDATRNSIEMAGRAYYSHKQLDHKNQSDIQEMLHEKGINWNDYPVPCKRGSCCIKQKYYIDDQGAEYTSNIKDNMIERSRWIIDKNIPIFKGEGRNYIEKLINIGG